MSIETAMSDACAAIGIEPPRQAKPGQWVKCPVLGKGRSNGAGRVLIFDDGRGGIAWNWVSGMEQRFTLEGMADRRQARASRRDPEAERAVREQQAAAERAAGAIVAACDQAPHPYLAAKGFGDEPGLVLEDPAALVPVGEDFDGMRYQIDQMTPPFLVVPGRIAQRIVTVQLIDATGAKLNMKAGPMRGAAHRIASGREMWVCEGIATAMSVRAALRLLGRSATVLSAFSAANVAVVAERLGGAVIAADHDKPLDQFQGKGTGEFYAARSGCAWVMPPSLGDWNDYHQAHGLRAVALLLREVRPP